MPDFGLTSVDPTDQPIGTTKVSEGLDLLVVGHSLAAMVLISDTTCTLPPLEQQKRSARQPSRP